MMIVTANAMFWEMVESEARKRVQSSAGEAESTIEFVEHDGCYFVAKLLQGARNSTLANFEDRTGYECFVNHVHIGGTSPVDALLASCCLLLKTRNAWRQSKFREFPLRHIVSGCDREFVYRFHVAREAESWLAADLNECKEIVLVVDDEV